MTGDFFCFLTRGGNHSDPAAFQRHPSDSFLKVLSFFYCRVRRGGTGDKRGKTCSKGPRAGIKPRSLRSRLSLNETHALNHWGAPRRHFLHQNSKKWTLSNPNERHPIPAVSGGSTLNCTLGKIVDWGSGVGRLLQICWRYPLSPFPFSHGFCEGTFSASRGAYMPIPQYGS